MNKSSEVTPNLDCLRLFKSGFVRLQWFPFLSIPLTFHLSTSLLSVPNILQCLVLFLTFRYSFNQPVSTYRNGFQGCYSDVEIWTDSLSIFFSTYRCRRPLISSSQLQHTGRLSFGSRFINFLVSYCSLPQFYYSSVTALQKFVWQVLEVGG